MYYKLGMSFPTEESIPDFGSITMYYVGRKESGYVEEGNKKFRKYAFISTDVAKLSNITNALDGSKAIAVDTGSTYVLYNNTWSEVEDITTATKEYVHELFDSIVSIDVQVVNELPSEGTIGVIYLINHSHGLNDIYDEYIWVKQNNNTYVYEKIGNTDINLGNYITKVTGVAGKVAKFAADGSIESTGYELGKTVPANAALTDTTYTLAQSQIDGHQITFTPSTGAATTITTVDTTYNVATQSVAGLMSASDKTKLDGITISDYLRKDDIVTLTAAEYEALVTKTAPYYFITDV